MEYSNSQMSRIIEEYIHDKKHRDVMLERMIDNVTIEKIAEDQDLSVSTVKRIIKKNMDIIYRHFPE